MTQRVLLGYDGRPESDDALDLAVVIAQALGATLVAGTISAKGALRARSGSARAVASERAGAGTLAAAERAIRERAPTVQVEKRTLAARGPAKGLRELAKLRTSSLVVVGSTQSGRLDRVVLGTTAEQLCRDSPCPVAVAPRGYRRRAVKELRVIGVAFDAGHEARRALAVAVSLAEGAAAGLRVFGVVEPVRLHGSAAPPGDVGTTEPRSNRGALDRKLEQVLAELPDEIAGQKVIREGDPVDALVDSGERACDLLVLGARLKRLLPGFLPGSVSLGVVEAAPWPVIVVPARAVLAPLMDGCQSWLFEDEPPASIGWRPPAFTRWRQRSDRGRQQSQ
jgi:nucleotide-binding universal stress UspA family protein